MKRRIFSWGLLTAALTSTLTAQAAPDELRVMVHSSFSLPKPMLAQFEAQANVKLSIIKGGDAGEMLNKLILTRAQPVADVVFGIDNALVLKAQAAQVIEPFPNTSLHGPAPLALGHGVARIPYSIAMTCVQTVRAMMPLVLH